MDDLAVTDLKAARSLLAAGACRCCRGDYAFASPSSSCPIAPPSRSGHFYVPAHAATSAAPSLEHDRWAIHSSRAGHPAFTHSINSLPRHREDRPRRIGSGRSPSVRRCQTCRVLTPKKSATSLTFSNVAIICMLILAGSMDEDLKLELGIALIPEFRRLRVRKWEDFLGFGTRNCGGRYRKWARASSRLYSLRIWCPWLSFNPGGAGIVLTFSEVAASASRFLFIP